MLRESWKFSLERRRHIDYLAQSYMIRSTGLLGPTRPDICIRKHDPNEVLGQHTSPVGGTRSHLRRNLTRTRTRHYMYAFETKPCWKFQFLEDQGSHQVLLDKFQVPANYTSEDMNNQKSLPRSWSTDKKKVFHLVRQVYGQMEATSRRYGVIHIYENWFFCKRTAEGMMQISSPIVRTDTAPSVFQALKTLTGFEDHELGPSVANPCSAMKPPPPERNQQQGGKRNSKLKRARGGDSKGSGSGTEAAAGLENLAATLSLWDCILVDVTDTIQLYETLVACEAAARSEHDARRRRDGKRGKIVRRHYRQGRSGRVPSTFSRIQYPYGCGNDIP